MSLGEQYWYEPRVIRFTRRQMIWGIAHAAELDENVWPDMPEEFWTDKAEVRKIKGKDGKEKIKIEWVEVLKLRSSYEDVGMVQTSQSRHAPFESPRMFAAEIRDRLRTTREAGEALVDEVPQALKLSGIWGGDSYEYLSRPARRALNYISGVKRRRQTYSQWKRDQDKVLERR